MMRDARPSGIAPPTIPLARLSGVEDVAHGAAQAVVASEGADAVAHDRAGFAGAEALAAAVEGEFQQIAAFKCIKHWDPSEMCPELAQKMVNIPLNARTMEARHA